MTMSRNTAALRARYEALLPKYGELWKSMAPRDPLSLLTAIENRETVSLKIPSCECPFNASCEGCAVPILELDDNSPSNSSSSSGDTAIGFDLSYIQLDREGESEGSPSMPVTGTFRDDLNDESTASSKNDSKCDENFQESASSSSSSGSPIQGYDLSHLHLEDDDESNHWSESSLAVSVPRHSSPVEFKDFMRNADASQVVDLLDDTGSEDELIVDGDSLVGKASVIEGSPEVNGVNRNRIDSKPAARVEHLSDSSEEEWDETMFDDESVTSQRSNQNRSPTVIVLSDSDDDTNEPWLQVDEESIDASDNGSLVANTDRFARRPFIRDNLLDNTLDTKALPKQVAVARENKGESKVSFRKHREQRARTLFADFDRVAFNGVLRKVELVWSNKLRTTAGLTRLKRKSGGGCTTERSASIELSTKIIDEEHRLRSTILHEMCHAAAWLVDGVSKPPHGSCFKKWANIAMQKVPSVIVTTTHDYEIAFKYAWACTAPKCGVIIQRHSRSVDVARHCCGKCKARLIEIEVPSGKGSNVEQTPKKQKALSGYNLFVKQNSKSVRGRLELEQRMQGSNAIVTQPDVMKECARLWRERNQIL